MRTVLGDVDALEWIPRQSIVFDWSNGPKQGICALAYPQTEFEFKCIAEKYNPDGIDHRLYSLLELPSGSVDCVLGLIKELGTPENTVWIPIWNFPTQEDKHKVNAQIDQLLGSGKPTNLIFYSQDLVSILGCWKVDSLPENVDDLFKTFGIENEAAGR